MKRTHLASSDAPIALREVEQLPFEKSSHAKPRGFWYEVNDDWQRWVLEEGFRLESWRFIYAVELRSCAVLRISTLAELDHFHEAFGKPFSYHITDRFRYVAIDWPHVAELFDGLEIAPYQWSRRLHIEYDWYYGWDCASGVIWRPKDAQVKLLGPHDMTAIHEQAQRDAKAVERW